MEVAVAVDEEEEVVVVVDVSGNYRTVSSPNSSVSYLVGKETELGCFPQYSFTTIPRRLSDFDEMCNYNQTSPESHFTQETVCTDATMSGRITLSDRNLKIRGDTEKTEIPTLSPKQYNRALYQHFGIDLVGRE